MARGGDNQVLGGSAAAITLVVAVAYAHVLIAGRTFASAVYLQETVPALTYIGDRISGLSVPEWWPGIGLGVPMAGNPDHPIFYPPVWLVGWLPDLATADALMLAHAVLLGVGVGRLARRFGSAPAETILAGGAAAAGGLVTGGIATGALMALAWTPWVLVAAARTGVAGDRWGRARGAVLLGVALALQLHAGRLELAIATACAAIGVAAMAAESGRLAAAGWSLIGCAAAALASAELLVPALFVDLAPSALAPPVGRDGVVGTIWPTGGAYLGPAVFLLALLAMRRRELRPVGVIAAVGIAVGAVGYGAALSPALVIAVALAGVGAGELRDAPAPAAVAAGAALAVVAAAGSFAAGEVVVGVGLAVVAAAALALARRPDHEAALAPVLAVAVVGPLIAVSWDALPRIDRAPFAGPPRIAEAPLAQRDAGEPPRLLRPPLAGVDRAEVEPATALELAHRTAAPNSVARFGGSQLRGRDRAADPRLLRAYRAAALASDRFLDLYAVDLVVLPRSVVTAAGMPVIADDPANRAALVDNDVRRPTAFVAARWRWYADDDSLLADLFPDAVGGPRGLPMATVRLSGAGADGGTERARPARPCAVGRPSPERTELRCPPPDEPGFAVLLDGPAPGWTATVDGASRPIERADLLARAVRIEPGESEIVFRYRAPGLRLGALIAGLAWLNLLVLAWLLRRRATPEP